MNKFFPKPLLFASVCHLAFEAEQQLKLEEELKTFDKQLEQEAEEEQKKNEKAILALNTRKEALLKEKKAKVKQEMDKMSKQGASKEDQEAILKEHSKDLAKLMNKMDADRMRMQSSLEERLKKRREAKRQAKVAELTTRNEEEKKEFEEKVQSERDRAQAEEVIALKESIHVDNLVAATIESEAASPPIQQARLMPDSYRLAAPLSEGELASLLLASPLYQKIESIKSLVSGGAGKGGQFGGSGKWKSIFLLMSSGQCYFKVPGRKFLELNKLASRIDFLRCGLSPLI